MPMDPRFRQLADGLLGFSLKLKKGENVLIKAIDVPTDMVKALIEGVRKRGAWPFVNLEQAAIKRILYRTGAKQQFETMNAHELVQMKAMDAYVALRGANNIFELSDIPAKQMQVVTRAFKPVLDWRVSKTRWVVLRWPTPAMAQQAVCSTETFEDFYFKVCTQDYARMIPGMRALKRLMERTDRVRITGPGTDLRFSIKDIDVVTCGGARNIPDGEVFTAPVKTSVEGEVSFNTPTVYEGVCFDSVRLVFKKGRIVEATANNAKRLNAILDSDPGARFIGEFSIGLNPYILQPMRDILFDEKIAGSFHFTPGQAYEIADNGNRSQVHWDLVCIQRPEYGGGQIYFDDKLIRKDGEFIPKALQKLNRSYLGQTEANR